MSGVVRWSKGKCPAAEGRLIMYKTLIKTHIDSKHRCTRFVGDVLLVMTLNSSTQDPVSGDLVHRCASVMGCMWSAGSTHRWSRGARWSSGSHRALGGGKIWQDKHLGFRNIQGSFISIQNWETNTPTTFCFGTGRSYTANLKYITLCPRG